MTRSTPRPFIGLDPSHLAQPLFGREKDLDWLRSGTLDRVLVGQPGMGKTALLAQWATEGGALFWVDKDREALEAAIRDLEPRTVIVDDAFKNLDDLESLMQVRSQIPSSSFAILASTWPGSKDAVCRKLGIREAEYRQRVRTLEGLTRREIRAIYNEKGLKAPEEILVELVKLADNRPGLAITIGRLWHDGDIERLLKGGAFRDGFLGGLKDRLGQKAIPVLSAIALSGDAGLSIEETSELLSLDIPDTFELAADLAAAGALTELGIGSESRLVVRPRELRAAVLEAGYCGVIRLDIGRHFARLRESKAGLRAVLFAAARGVEIRRDWLFSKVCEQEAAEFWRDYAWIDENAARQVLENYQWLETWLPRHRVESLPKWLSDRLHRLDQSARLELVRLSSTAGPAILRTLVNSEVPVFREALACFPQQECLAVLGYWPDETWEELAIVALEGSMRAASLANAVFSSVGAVASGDPEPWIKLHDRFAAMKNPLLREISNHGRQLADEQIRLAQAQDRQFELTGTIS